MDGVIDAIKKHPLILIGAALVIILIVSRSGSSTSSSGAGAALQAQATAGSTDVQLSSINAGLTATNNGYVKDMYVAGAGAAASKYATNTAAIISAFTTLVQHQDNQTAMADQLSLGSEQIQATSEANASNDMYNLLGLQTNLVAQQKLTDTLLASNSAETSKTLAFEQANLPSLLSHAENLAKINGGTSVQLAQVAGNTSVANSTIQGNTAQQVAATNAQAANTTANAKANSSNVSSLASLIGTFASFF